MTRKIKSIGHVVPLSTGGYVVRVERYGSGRLLPEPRTLLQTDGQPFASLLDALDMLRVWSSAPRSMRQLTASPAMPQKLPEPRAAARQRVLPLVNHALDYEDEHRPARKPVKRARPVTLPAIAKVFPDTPARCVKGRDAVSQRIDELIASGVVEVTRCPPGLTHGMNHLYERRGGVVPAHLDPVTLD